MTYEMTSTAPALLFSAMKVIRVSTTLLIPHVSDDDQNLGISVRIEIGNK
jgi:hypothetical protein